ncbi:hypothetical protein EJB05_14594 [Eragrostis curvula]|uniref:Uncharacterized protein n=1 Tax=Eragrostis curvula TaxID=38414 RepID=A0A5J9W1A3_9POAL|nr:hypothetical protein EJB05_14594 [Eragrostis curvula]
MRLGFSPSFATLNCAEESFVDPLERRRQVAYQESIKGDDYDTVIAKQPRGKLKNQNSERQKRQCAFRPVSPIRLPLLLENKLTLKPLEWHHAAIFGENNNHGTSQPSQLSALTGNIKEARLVNSTKRPLCDITNIEVAVGKENQAVEKHGDTQESRGRKKFHRRSSFAGDLIPLPQVLITDRAGDEAASSFDPV